MSALGSLVVKLALQHAEFTGGLDKSEQAALVAAKRIQDTFDGMKSRIANTAGAIAGGLAAGFTVAAFKNIIQGSIDTGAALDDLRQQTGATGEALSALLAVGKFNDVGPEQLGGAMNKLAANLAGATEESKGTGKALAALGLNMEEFRKLKPEDQIQEVAKAMGGFEDGAGKSAVAMALFGKEGAKMIPFFNDLAAAGELQAKMTDEQIAASANLDDNLKRLAMSGDGWKKELANGMIPALDLGAQALLDVMNGTGGLREKVKGLAGDGSIKEWTNNAIIGFSYVADVVQGLMSLFPIMGKAIGAAMAATSEVVSSVYSAFQKIRGGDLGGAMTDLETGFSRVKTIGVEAGQDISEVWNQKLFGERLRERMGELDSVSAKTEKVGDESEKAKRKQLDFVNSVDKTAKAAAEAKDPVAALLDTISKRTAAFASELAAGEKLTEGEKASIEVLEQLRTGKVKVTQAEAELIGVRLEAMLAAEQQLALHQQELKQMEAARSERMKLYQAVEQGVESLAAQNQSLSEEIELIGLSEEAQLAVIRGRNDRVIATKQATLAELELQAATTGTMTRQQIALQQEIDKLKERNELLGKKADVTAAAKAVEAQSAAWLDMWNSVDRTAHDVFVDVANNGMSAFKRIGKTLQASVLDLLYQMTLRKWIFQIMASVTGSVASSAASAAGSSMMGSVGGSMLGNMVGGVGALTGAMGSGFSMALNGGMGLALEGGVAMLGSATGMSSALAGIGQIVGALGPIALGIGALYSIISSFDDSGTYHTGGAAQYSAATGLRTSLGFRDNEEGLPSYNPNDNIDNQFGTGFGYVERGDQTIDVVSNLARGLGMALDGVAVAFGEKAGYAVATAFADDTSGDGAWGALRISKDGQELLNWQDTRTSRWAPKEFGDGEAGYKEYLAAVAKDTRQVLLDMDLPSWADNMLTSIGDSASMEQLTGVLTQIGVVQSAFVSLGNSMAMFANMTDEMQSGLLAAAGSIDALTAGAGAFYQGFYSEQERVDAAVAQLNKTLGGLKLSIDPRLGDDAKGQFRAAVEAAFAAGDAELATALLAISGNFANAADYFEQLSQQAADAAAQAAERQADTMGRLQIDLLRAQGNETAAVALERERELAALTQFGPAAVAVQRQIYGLIDAMAAANAAASAYFAGIDRAAAERGYNEQAQAALDALFGSVNSGATSAAQAAADAAATAAASWRSAASSIQSSLEKLRAGTTDLTDPASRYAETKGVLDEYTRLALGGDASAAAKLAGAADAFLAASAGGTMTQAEYLRDRVLTEAKLASALESSEAQSSLQESIATAARATVSELQALNNNLTGFAGDLYDLLRNSYPDVGRDGATTVAASLAKMQADFDAYFNATTGWAAVGSKYSDPSFGGASFTKLDNNTAQFTGADGVVNYLRAGESLLDVAKRIPELRKLWEQTYNIRLPAFAEGGMHAGGLRLVGERGWEIEATGPARYWNQAQLSQALTPGPAGADNAEVVAELRRVSAQLSRMEARLAEIEKTNDQMAQQQDNGTDGGNAYRAEIMNVAALAQAIKEATV
ncbi:MAG: hypothetical protein ACK4OH_10895 [Acidovorax temperans]|uniref:hypothetical protein n=1 Tax=Acidovorax temperans TaxID=80878 RepID=UPI00391A277A